MEIIKVLEAILLWGGLILATLSMNKGKCGYVGWISGWFGALRGAPRVTEGWLRVSGYRLGRWKWQRRFRRNLAIRWPHTKKRCMLKNAIFDDFRRFLAVWLRYQYWPWSSWISHSIMIIFFSTHSYGPLASFHRVLIWISIYAGPHYRRRKRWFTNNQNWL